MCEVEGVECEECGCEVWGGDMECGVWEGVRSIWGADIGSNMNVCSVWNVSVWNVSVCGCVECECVWSVWMCGM